LNIPRRESEILWMGSNILGEGEILHVGSNVPREGGGEEIIADGFEYPGWGEGER
jgi:hypothetical protein